MIAAYAGRRLFPQPMQHWIKLTVAPLPERYRIRQRRQDLGPAPSIRRGQRFFSSGEDCPGCSTGRLGRARISLLEGVLRSPCFPNCLAGKRTRFGLTGESLIALDLMGVVLSHMLTCV